MPRTIKTTDGRVVPDPRATEAWKQLALQVCRDEPICWLQFPGCTNLSTTGDHLVPVPDRPDLALVRGNVRGACAKCNNRRSNTPLEALRITTAETKPPPALDVFG